MPWHSFGLSHISSLWSLEASSPLVTLSFQLLSFIYSFIYQDVCQAAELLSVPVTEWIKKAQHTRHHEEKAPSSLLIQGLIRRHPAPKAFCLVKNRIRRERFEFLLLPTDCLTYGEHPASLLWLSTMQMCWRKIDNNTYVAWRNFFLFHPKFSLNFPSGWFSSEHNPGWDKMPGRQITHTFTFGSGTTVSGELLPVKSKLLKCNTEFTQSMKLPPCRYFPPKNTQNP